MPPPKDFTDFNIESTLRICNSLDTKVRKYRKYSAPEIESPQAHLGHT